LPDSYKSPDSAPVDFSDLRLDRLDLDLQSPTDVAALGNELLVTERAGRVQRLAQSGSGYAMSEVVDLREAVGGTESEKGLLGIAVHPDGDRFYVNHTRAEDGATVIAEYALSDAGGADYQRDVLVVEQPFPNHNGGDLTFGPDKMLYVGMGDGGAGGDPNGNAQRLDTNLGKILRMDVDSGELVPPDNPHGSLVWFRGARNPWRITFDAETGDMWITDVGQDRWEEINVVSDAVEGGADLGWDKLEGLEEFEDAGPDAGWPDDDGRRIDPVHVYSHDDGRCSIVGGYVVRNASSPLDGLFLYSDFCDGEIRILGRDGAPATTDLQVDSVISINPDENGDPLVLTMNGMYRISG
jgi:hypothetical protein